MKPRSWAASVASSPIPMFVGEVRCATRGSGVSWKLSAGRPWSSGPMKRLEVAPGVAGDALEEGAVLGAELQPPLRHGPAQGVGDERRGGPQQRAPAAAAASAAGRATDDERQAEQGDQRARDHLHHEGARAAAAASRARRSPRPSPTPAGGASWPPAGRASGRSRAPSPRPGSRGTSAAGRPAPAPCWRPPSRHAGRRATAAAAADRRGS